MSINPHCWVRFYVALLPFLRRHLSGRACCHPQKLLPCLSVYYNRRLAPELMRILRLGSFYGRDRGSKSAHVRASLAIVVQLMACHILCLALSFRNFPILYVSGWAKAERCFVTMITMPIKFELIETIDQPKDGALNSRRSFFCFTFW